MKTKILLLLLLGWVGVVYGQIQNKVFVLDLKQPHSNSLKAEENDSKNQLVINTKELLAFKLVNGNPYKYKYVINHQFINFFEGQNENPLQVINKNMGAVKADSLKSFNKITLLAIKKDELIEKEKSFMLLDKKGEKTKNIFFDKIKLEGEIFDLKNDIIKLKDIINLNGYLSESPFSTNFINQHNQTKLPTAKNKKEDISNINNAFELLKKDFEDFKNEIEAYILKISSEDFLDEAMFTPSRESFKTKYMKLLADQKGIIDEAAVFPEILSEFNKKKKGIDSISEKISSEISKMYGVKLYSYTLPKDINGKNIDVVEITLERYDKTITNPTPDIYRYNIWVTGGVKIDISGGIFLTSLMNKEYETKDDTGTNKFIYEKNKGNYDFGFGSSINISLRSGSWIRPALGIGALFTTGQKFQIITGLGLIIGKEERIILHGGLAMGAITVISNNYKTDGSTSYNLGGDGAIPTTNKFSFGHFFGVTYNLGKVKKQDTPK
ncbi:hypothetical protein [Chryseobacterium sp.]|uniref:hypothetical protein n=1 Tax=Chryseobacterium sp. TaxID=1871047 RepID=UPI002898A3F9|nr:hypothetical protein [Chryseobacterium sp.]